MTEKLDPSIVTILIHARIDPRSVIDIKKINNKCPWCQQSCGHIAILHPCNHSICSRCLDSHHEQCPHCSELFEDFKWKL